MSSSKLSSKNILTQPTCTSIYSRDLSSSGSGNNFLVEANSMSLPISLTQLQMELLSETQADGCKLNVMITRITRILNSILHVLLRCADVSASINSGSPINENRAPLPLSIRCTIGADYCPMECLPLARASVFAGASIVVLGSCVHYPRILRGSSVRVRLLL